MEYFCQLPLSKRHAINVARLRKAATPAELQMKDFLASLGAPYRFQQGFYSPYYRIVDFYLPTMNLVIEIDGPCHDAAKDRRRDDWFTRVRGIKIVRLTNEQVLSGDLPCFLNQFLNGLDPPARSAFDRRIADNGNIMISGSKVEFPGDAGEHPPVASFQPGVRPHLRKKENTSR